MILARLFALAGIGAVLLAAPGRAAPYTAQYVFGDSLSDNGNLAEVLYHQNFPNPPSFDDSFTNGPTANAALAQSLGLTLRPSLWVTAFQDTFNLFGGAGFVPGTNYAVAGATAALQAQGGPPGINLPNQVAAYQAFVTAFGTGKADPDALYVVEIGGNDVRAAAIQGTGTAAIASGVNAELASIATLAGLGAKNLLVINVPDVGVIPEFAQGDPSLAAAATSYSQSYNLLLSQGLAALGLPADVSLTQFDLYAAQNDLLANAARYGISNTTDPCYTNTPLVAVTTAACGPGGSNIAQFFFWDSIHPTSAVNAVLASELETAIGVPEPSTLTVLGTGIAGLTILRRRRTSLL